MPEFTATDSPVSHSTVVDSPVSDPTASGSSVRAVVTGTVAEVLNVDPGALAATATLSDLPTYNSFRIVEIVELIEERLGVELDAADLVPDNLTRLDALCTLFERTHANGRL